MRSVCEMIKKQTDSNFINLRTAILTYDREALVCGAPAWRYVYHTIHSADKWFFNPFVYEEPSFHVDGMDNGLTPDERNHSTETGLDNFNDYDFIVNNSGNLDELKEKVYEVLE